jgi:hypothetical protein
VLDIQAPAPPQRSPPPPPPGKEFTLAVVHEESVDTCWWRRRTPEERYSYDQAMSSLQERLLAQFKLQQQSEASWKTHWELEALNAAIADCNVVRVELIKAHLADEANEPLLAPPLWKGKHVRHLWYPLARNSPDCWPPEKSDRYFPVKPAIKAHEVGHHPVPLQAQIPRWKDGQYGKSLI